MTFTTDQTIHLRPAEPEDADFLFELYCSTRAEELAAWNLEETQQQVFLDLQFRAQQAHYNQYPNLDHRIILENGNRIGRIMVSRLENEIRLADISLLTEARGKSIGAKLISDLQTEAGQSGKPLRLHVEKNNRALRLYQRLGFTITNDLGFHYFMEWRPAQNSGDK